MVVRKKCSPTWQRSERAQRRIGLILVQEAILAVVHTNAVATNRWAAISNQNGTDPAFSQTVFQPWGAEIDCYGRPKLLSSQIEVRIDFLLLKHSVA